MEALLRAQITLTYVFTTALRGFHVYRSEWKPYLGQNITFKQEFENPHDRFAVAGKANLPGKLCAVSVALRGFHVYRSESCAKGNESPCLVCNNGGS